MIIFKRLAFCITFFFTINNTFADVWVDSNTWNSDWETKYSKWVKEDVKSDVFTKGKWKDLSTDCADAIYTIRAIFAYENNLPFHFRNPNKYGQRFTNKMSQFNRFTKASDTRFKKFLYWMHRLISTYSMGYDTYSPKLDSVGAGTPFLLHKFHVYLIKDINIIGIPTLLSSTVPRKVRALDTDFMVPNPDKEEMTFDLGGFRAWRNPNLLFASKAKLKSLNLYSSKQYEIFAKANLEDLSFEDLIALELSGGVNESLEQKLDRYIKLVTDQFKERVHVVQSGFDYSVQIGRRMNESEYYAHSTPTRDGRLEELVDSLFDIVRQIVEEDNKKQNILKEKLIDQRLTLKEGLEVNLFKLIFDFYNQDIEFSNDPHDTIEQRWGQSN
tara:strand:+ start:784 stop:1938 length:1155 start_codon:yes stop_codon:yes gene_type:complete